MKPITNIIKVTLEKPPFSIISNVMYPTAIKNIHNSVYFIIYSTKTKSKFHGFFDRYTNLHLVTK